MEVILIDLFYVAILEMKSACNKFERERYFQAICCYLKGAQWDEKETPLLSSIGAPEFSSFECQSMTNGVGIDFGS
jgi:hypothetical protein